MNIGYARVSTAEQHPDLQLAALKKAGCRTIYTETATGVHTARPALATCLKALTAGDTLMVWKLDRLGRSLRDLITLLDDLKARGVLFRSLTEAIDTAPPPAGRCGTWWGSWPHWSAPSSRNAPKPAGRRPKPGE